VPASAEPSDEPHVARHHHADFLLAVLLFVTAVRSQRLGPSLPVLYPKPIKKRPSSMDVITPFTRCVHSYPIPPRQQGVPHGNPLSQPLFRALRPQSTSINYSISTGSRAQQGVETDSWDMPK